MLRAWPMYTLLVCALAFANAKPSARTVGDLQFVYDWAAENCAQKHPPDLARCSFSFKCKNMTEQNLGLCRDCDPDVVDAPTKAFRRRSQHGGEETVLMGSVNWGSRYEVGPTLDTVKHNCTVFYNARQVLRVVRIPLIEPLRLAL